MKQTFFALTVLFLTLLLASCARNNDSDTDSLDDCEVNFEPYLSDESNMPISSAFLENNSLAAYYQHPRNFRSITAFPFGLVIPTDSDCTVNDNQQIWEQASNNIYSYYEVNHYEDSLTIRNITRNGSLTNTTYHFREMRDHSSGILETIDSTNRIRSLIEWTNTDGNVHIGNRFFNNFSPISNEELIVNYNADGSGSYETNEFNNLQTIIWEADGSGSYTNRNDPSLNEIW